MNKYFLFPLLFLPSGRIVAQPQLSRTTNAPSLGDSYVRYYSAYLDPGASGAQVVWDLTALDQADEEVMQVVPAGTTPGGSVFPAGTLALVGNESTTYLKAFDVGLVMAGTAADGQFVQLSDEQLQMQYPCSLGTNWVDQTEGMYESDGDLWTRTGSISAHADGYGTLRLPTGDVPNVLRIRTVENVTDASDGFEVTSTVVTYSYYAVGTRWPLVQLIQETIEIFGTPLDLEFAIWSSPLSTGVEDTRDTPLSLSAYPNPAQTMFTLALPSEEGFELSIADLQGRVVEQAVALPGTAQCRFDVGQLASGSYVVTARDRSGRSGSTRIVVR